MKNLEVLLSELVGKSAKTGFSVNSVLFEILKGGNKLTRDELKMEMLKFRFVSEYGELKEEHFKDEKMIEVIKKLSVTSRNSIDTIISKNNNSFIFKDIKGFETKKVVLENGRYFIG
jgi:hypothetical protein